MSVAAIVRWRLTEALPAVLGGESRWWWELTRAWGADPDVDSPPPITFGDGQASAERLAHPQREDSPMATTDSQTQPHLHQRGPEVQRFDQLRDLPIGLEATDRAQIAAGLNQIFADTRILHDLYKKHHWMMRGETFYQLHLLMDKHAGEQAALVDKIAERIQTLGAIALGDPRHVAEVTSIPRPPDGAESVAVMLSRTLEAHDAIIIRARELDELVDELGDPATEDLLGSEVLPTNELQVWFVSEHLVDVPLIDSPTDA